MTSLWNELLEAWTGADGAPVFRVAAAAFTAFLLSLVAGPPLIALLRRRQFLDAPQKGDSAELDAMHAHKKSTPTMGGLLLIVAVCIPALGFARHSDGTVLLAVLVMLSYGALGFVDDLIQVRRRRKGLRPRVKLAAQVLLAASAGTYLYLAPPAVTVVGEPAGGHGLFLPFLGTGSHVSLGPAYVLLVVLVLTASSNAVNLTDGLDGLAAGCAGMVAAVFVVIALAASDAGASASLGVPFVPGGGEAGIFAGALLGGSLGFLWFNCHPARVFMGDTGALPLGAALGLVAVLLKQELLLVLVGGVLVAEAVSVILQVFWFKTRGRRIFLIAPLHHHYQFKGWSESKVTVRFWCAATVLAGVTLAMLRLF